MRPERDLSEPSVQERGPTAQAGEFNKPYGLPRALKKPFSAFFLEQTKMPRYWLMKSEPSVVGIDHVLAMKNQTVDWWGVRNYQARNFMRDQMAVGDKVFFYHSSCPEPGIAGLAEVASSAYPDRTQFDPKSPYFDPKSTAEAPRWVNVDVRITKKTRLIGLDELRAHPQLANMRALQKGNRLSITPVDPAEWKFITGKLLK